MNGVERVWEALRGARRLLVSTHLNPDGDAISSELALDWILRGSGADITIVNQSPYPDPYRFLPGIERIHLYKGASYAPFPVLVALDCGRKNRLGDFVEKIECGTVVNIDHHISNDEFGDVNWIDPKASSTGELLLSLADHAGVPIGPELATCLYTGILTDTGNFTFANTTPCCHRLASRLIECGADPAEISRYLYRSRSVGKLRLQARLITELHVDEEASLAWASLTREMCDDAGVSITDALDLVTIPLSVDGVDLGILFREFEEPGKTKVSFRSEGEPDVSLLARELGGGGHPSAAGCTLEMELDDAVAAVVPWVYDRLGRRSRKPTLAMLRMRQPKGLEA